MIKTKQVLIALAVIGANVLHNMPVHTAMAAAENIWWYGTTGGFVDIKPPLAVTTDVNLTITDDTQVSGKTVVAVNKDIYGGYTDGSEDVKNNSITFDTTYTTSATYIYGGYSKTGGAKNNTVTVTVNNGTIDSQIYGGWGNKGTVEGNLVTINGGTLKKLICGGKGDNGYEVKGNSVIVNGGEFTNSNAISGGNGSGNVTGNKVVIEEIFGNVTFSGSWIYGGSGQGLSSSATENEVTIKGGTFSNNNLQIYGANSGGDAKDNTVTIEGGTFVDGFSLYGGKAGSSKVSSGNTLNLKTVIGGTAKEVKYFQNVNFTLPEGATSEVTMLKVGTTPMALAGITFTTDLNGLALTGNDYITLVRGVNGTVGALAGQGNYYVLDVGGVNELVYSNGTPVAKGDYTIKQGGVKGDSGTTGSYTGSIYGNTDGAGLNVTGGTLSATSYSNNEVIIRRGTYAPAVGNIAVAGAYNITTDEAISNNTVKIYDGKFKGDIYGGHSTYGEVSGNTVNIYGGTLGESNPINIYGGYSNTNNVTGNVTNIEGGTFASGSYIRGGGSNSGSATKNTLTIKGGTFSGENNNFYGGESNNGNAGGDSEDKGNKVVIDNATFNSGTSNKIYGGYAGNTGGIAQYNSVTINDGTFKAASGDFGLAVAGGYAAGTAQYNAVTINGGTFSASAAKKIQIIGGYAGSSDASHNTVAIKNGTFGANTLTYGGCSEAANVTSNVVEISDGEFGDNAHIYGGYSGNAGGDTPESGNKVIIKNGTFGGQIYGGRGENGFAKNNSVTIDKGTFSKKIYGGYSKTTGNADGNSVTINGGTFKDNIIGGYSKDSGNTESNSVTITDGTILEHVFGGASEGSGNVEKNTVTISGGTFGDIGNIYGGGYSVGGNATDNTLNIEGGTFTDGFNFYGGWASGGKTSSGNILNLKTKVGGKAKEVGYFQIMNFTLPEGIKAGDTMLSTQTMNFDTTKTTINVDAFSAILNDGDVITLIASDNVPTGVWEAGTVTGADGTITLSGNNLILTIDEPTPPPPPPPPARNYDKEKAPVEGIAAVVQTVNMSADLASGEGMRSLILETVGGFTNTFGALTAGHSKYKTGSHVDVDGWGVVVGAGKTKDWGNGEATSLGVFLEYGKGNFDTYNGSIHGDGNSENKGIGFMMRHKMMNNTYYEGNIRYGKVETDWSESEVGGYNTDSKYYGISVGMGHIFPAGKNEIDVYGRYTYGHVGSSDARVGTKDYHFDSVKSHRVRIGGKYNFKQENSNAKPFVGLAWEHEFKGESKASIAGVGEAPAPSMKGNTGIMEVGCDWNLGKKWTAGISADAYVGKRKGWDGMARIFYNF